MRFITCFLFCCFWAVGAQAQSIELNADQQADVIKAELYLNNMKTLKAQFLQTNQDGGVAKGMLYIRRPGRMRIEYETPNNSLLVADGSFVHFWDDGLQQTSSVPLGQSIADVILKENLSLMNDMCLVQVQRFAGILEITVADKNDEIGGQITLVFADKPLQFKQWKVIDAQGYLTRVSLQDISENEDLPNSLFQYRQPSFGQTNKLITPKR